MRTPTMITIRRLGVAVTLVVAAAVPAAWAQQAAPYPNSNDYPWYQPPTPSGPTHAYGEMVDYPLAFPVAGPHHFTDTFYSPRSYPDPEHHAQDLMADKMVPVVSAITGTIRSINWSHDEEDIDPTRCCTLVIRSDDGWETWYLHLNNDTPGTDDGLGWGISPDIHIGTRVQAGQLIGWVGDSGNAESTSPHLHFELHDPYGVAVNPYQALLDADAGGGLLACSGVPATIIGDVDHDGTITGTSGNDVIIGTSGNDVIDGGDGNDRICGLGGADVIDAGAGDDKVIGGGGGDTLYGGDGNDVLLAGGGSDMIDAGDGNDRVKGARGNDEIFGGNGDDRLFGGAGNDVGDAGSGSDRCVVENPTQCET